MTVLDLWKQSPDDQKIAERFFTDQTGQRLLAILRDHNTPRASTLAGMDGIHEDSKALQRCEGGKATLELIPTLFFSSIHVQKGQAAAVADLAKKRAEHMSVGVRANDEP